MNSAQAHSLFDQLNAALPQTQCTRCGYADCAAYAQAIAAGQAPINQCPPGGAEGVARLARITGLAALPLNPVHGLESSRAVAIIDENWCIGCTLCIKACPTDAIMGSNKLMHTVIEPYCTGCELCIPVCPVDCISLENVTGTRTGWQAWSQPAADMAKKRYEFHSSSRSNHNDLSTKQAKTTADVEASDTPVSPASPVSPADRKRAVIEAALARARGQRNDKPL